MRESPSDSGTRSRLSVRPLTSRPGPAYLPSVLSHGTLSRRDPRPLTDHRRATISPDEFAILLRRTDHRKPGLLRSWWHVAFWAGWGLLFWAVVAAALWIATR